jgi:transposase, IS30 family
LKKIETGQLTIPSCHTFSCEAKGGHMRKYRQLGFEDRIYIEVWQSEKVNQATIAKRLGVHRSTICRELKRGKSDWGRRTYQAHLGESHMHRSSRMRGRPCKIVGELKEVVIRLIREDWSPEQICGRLKLEKGIQLSHETIYSFIYSDKKNNGSLYFHLRRGRRRRKKRFTVPRIRADILNRKNISDRPEIINSRERVGDWERDLMFAQSRSEALLTMVERKTLFTLLRRVESKSPKVIAEKTISALSQQCCLSITNDNGFEFRDHQKESTALNVPIYFTNPYSSWEKGTCENLNGLVRQYMPRTKVLKEMTDEQIKQIEDRLNSRPRKKLGFKTPLEEIYSGATHQLCKLKGNYHREVALFF